MTREERMAHWNRFIDTIRESGNPEVWIKEFFRIVDEVEAHAVIQLGLHGFGEVMKDRDALLTTLQTEVEKLPSIDEDDVYDNNDLIQRSKIGAIINKLRNEGM